MNELIARVAASAGISDELARRAVNLIFAFLKRQAPEAFGELEQKLPEAGAAAAASESDTPGSGLLGGLMSKMGGGGLMGLAGQLTSIGLGTGEMQAVGKEIFAFARERAGDERVDEVVAAIPGLGAML